MAEWRYVAHVKSEGPSGTWTVDSGLSVKSAQEGNANFDLACERCKQQHGERLLSVALQRWDATAEDWQEVKSWGS
jgi:hypothetical protein